MDDVVYILDMSEEELIRELRVKLGIAREASTVAEAIMAELDRRANA